MYPECFYGIGKFNNYEYHITLEDNVKPITNPIRKFPLACQPKLDKELDEMVEQGIITTVNGPSACVNAPVICKKPSGRLRTCFDPKDLNKVIKREHNPMQTLDNITPKLCGSTLFSKCKAMQWYWNVKLDEESSYMTPVTPIGVAIDSLECPLD